MSTVLNRNTGERLLAVETPKVCMSVIFRSPAMASEKYGDRMLNVQAGMRAQCVEFDSAMAKVAFKAFGVDWEVCVSHNCVIAVETNAQAVI